MSEKIDQFCESLKEKLTSLESKLEAVKTSLKSAP